MRSGKGERKDGEETKKREGERFPKTLTFRGDQTCGRKIDTLDHTSVVPKSYLGMRGALRS